MSDNTTDKERGTIEKTINELNVSQLFAARDPQEISSYHCDWYCTLHKKLFIRNFQLIENQTLQGR